MQDETSGAGGVAVAMAPSTGMHMHPVKLYNPRNPGQFADCTIKAYDGDGKDYIAYLVQTKRGEFALWRNRKDPRCLWVTNTKNHPGNLRGWEWFYETNCGLVVPFK